MSLEPTYEGLKHEGSERRNERKGCLEPTYEGLKRQKGSVTIGEEDCLEPTYEGLKQQLAGRPGRPTPPFGAYL